MFIRSVFAILTLLALGTPLIQGQTAGALPDLVVVDMTLSPDSPKPLELVTVSITVKNVGDGPAAAFRVAFTATSTLTKAVKEGLAPAETATVRFSWFGPQGQHTLLAEANPFMDVEEINVDNNSRSLEVLVAPEPLPDLTIESLSVSPANPLPGEGAVIEVVVKNTGILAPNGRAALRVKDDLGTLGTRFVDPLAPGERATFSIPWTPQLGERRLSVEVDVLARIDELDEDNNLLVQIITITPSRPTGANLAIHDLHAEPENPSLGEIVTLSAVVANIGKGIAEDFAVVFQADGAAIDALQIDTLPPGARTTVSATWQATGSGEHLIRIKADGAGVIAEPDESDNAGSGFIQVGDSIEPCGQLVWLQLEEASALILAKALAISVEEVNNVFMPKVKLAMASDYKGVNIRFSLNRPVGLHSRLRFIADVPPDTRLGQAPLDFNNRNKADIGLVFVAGFESGLSRGQAFSRSLDSEAQALAKVASHETGHFLGLQHDTEATTDRFGGQNIMAPSVDTVTASLFVDSFFTEANLAYLRGILPLTCN